MTTRKDEMQSDLGKISHWPWIAEGIGSEGYFIKVDVRGVASEVYHLLGFRGTIGEVRAGRDWQELRANAEFMAKAPERIDYLLQENKRLREALEKIDDAWDGEEHTAHDASWKVDDIVRETLRPYKTTMQVCPDCEGDRYIGNGRIVCQRCSGTGTVAKEETTR